MNFTMEGLTGTGKSVKLESVSKSKEMQFRMDWVAF